MTDAKKLVAAVLAKAKKAVTKGERLPVPKTKKPRGQWGTSGKVLPPVTKSESVLVDDPKKFDIPVELQVQNRQPLTTEQQEKVTAAFTKAADLAMPMMDPATAKLAQEIEDAKAAKAKATVEKRKAKQSVVQADLNGERRAMPVTGKAAESLIAAKATAEFEKNGGKVTKVPALLRSPTNGAGKPTGAVKAKGGRVAAPPAGKRAKSPPKAGAGVRPGSKVGVIAGLLGRKGGCTAADVLKATGWPSVSMPQQAKAAGLKLRKDKAKGQPTRYFAG